MDILHPSLEKYVEEHTSPETSLLHKVNRETHLEVLKPRMLSGHVQGALLSSIAFMLRPKKVLEIGTYTGYSALAFLQGMPEDGLLYTIDINEELEQRVEGYLVESGKADQVRQIIGNALDVVPELDEIFDLVFIDADKENYLRYYEMVIEKVQTGGFIIADNVLWSGKVVDKNANDTLTEAIREYNNHVQNDNRVENILLPVRDGLMISRKL